MSDAKKITPIAATELNSYCVFKGEWESDPTIFFHMTSQENVCSILSDGFKSAADLGCGTLTSVSYAKKSSACFANLGTKLDLPKAIFAVKFTREQLLKVVDNPTDVHVFRPDLQPEILAYCELPSGYQLG